MPEKFSPHNNLNEHLKEGVKPIIVCVGTPQDLFVDLQEINKENSRNKKEITNIDYSYFIFILLLFYKIVYIFN